MEGTKTRPESEITQLLDVELAICTRIEQLEQHIRDAVVKIAPQDLDRLSHDLQALIFRAGQTALSRLKLQEEVRRSLGLPESQVQLSSLTAHMPADAREGLTDRTDRLKKAYRKVARATATNKILMEEYLRGAREFFHVLAGSDETAPAYSRRGRKVEPPASFPLFEQTA